MKRYEVRYLVRVVMEVEADNKDDARDAAARVFGGLRGLDGIRLGRQPSRVSLRPVTTKTKKTSGNGETNDTKEYRDSE